MLSEADKDLLRLKGITEAQLLEQLGRFRVGFPFLEVKKPATKGYGVVSLSEQDIQKYVNVWDDYLARGYKVMKFVPASGAASRMFKDLFNFLDKPLGVPETDFEKSFFQQIEKFAFFEKLNAISLSKTAKGVRQLMDEKRYKEVVNLLLTDVGLNYGSLPKGLLDFHKYNEGVRTAIEEHLVEGALYAAGKSGEVKLHLTVSQEHLNLFEVLLKDRKEEYEKLFNVKYDISFSVQDPSTDTIAVDEDNQPFRDKGNLLFRPGGHGALIQNLNRINSDIIFIKNIDNVVPDKIKKEQIKYKKVLAGMLVEVQQKIFRYLELLYRGNYTHDELIEILYFLQNELNTKNLETKYLEDSELALYLKAKLDRPLRVCGVVKNEGEPGGGPFYVVNSDGTISLQILEESQIDKSIERNSEMMKQSAYFNPVDLVCAVKGFEGQKFDLVKYIDPDTGFISLKTKDGKSLKALELPGLWNGAMSDWNTVFVEVPISTFNPVKTIQDLLRENHLS